MTDREVGDEIVEVPINGGLYRHLRALHRSERDDMLFQILKWFAENPSFIYKATREQHVGIGSMLRFVLEAMEAISVEGISHKVAEWTKHGDWDRVADYLDECAETPVLINEEALRLAATIVRAKDRRKAQKVRAHREGKPPKAYTENNSRRRAAFVLWEMYRGKSPMEAYRSCRGLDGQNSPICAGRLGCLRLWPTANRHHIIYFEAVFRFVHITRRETWNLTAEQRTKIMEGFRPQWCTTIH